MTNRIRIALAALGVLAGAGLGCGDGGGGSGPSPSDLVGTWGATSVELASIEDPSQVVDGLEGGGTLTLWIYDDHTWESLQTDPVDPDIVSSGTWSLSGSTLTVTEGGESMNYRVRCDGTTMTLTARVTWDYDQDGTEEPARVTMEFAQ